MERMEGERVSKPTEVYRAPELPADFDSLKPDVALRLQNVQAMFDEARQNGYSWFQQARAQQQAAEEFLSRGDQRNYEILINGIQPANGGGVQGVRFMDDMARLWWSRARAYKIELDALKAEQAAAKGDE